MRSSEQIMCGMARSPDAAVATLKQLLVGADALGGADAVGGRSGGGKVLLAWDHRADLATSGHAEAVVLDAAVEAGFTLRWVCPRPDTPIAIGSSGGVSSDGTVGDRHHGHNGSDHKKDRAFNHPNQQRCQEFLQALMQQRMDMLRDFVFADFRMVVLELLLPQ